MQGKGGNRSYQLYDDLGQNKSVSIIHMGGAPHRDPLKAEVIAISRIVIEDVIVSRGLTSLTTHYEPWLKEVLGAMSLRQTSVTGWHAFW
jgi:hypothetical protein